MKIAFNPCKAPKELVQTIAHHVQDKLFEMGFRWEGYGATWHGEAFMSDSLYIGRISNSPMELDRGARCSDVLTFEYGEIAEFLREAKKYVEVVIPKKVCIQGVNVAISKDKITLDFRTLEEAVTAEAKKIQATLQ